MTQTIMPNILDLAQHVFNQNSSMAHYCPELCSSCGHPRLWGHGTYPRKADRSGDGKQSLNPILIARFYCPECDKTCSVLPECISPRRWYLWAIQQAVILAYLGGASIRQISRQFQPCRKTIKRWFDDLADKFNEHAFSLKARFLFLGECTECMSFWEACLHRMSMARAFYYLHLAGRIIP